MSTLTAPTTAAEGGTDEAGVPPAPPEAHQGAAAGKTECLGTATYSPEDNKLRMYPFARLDAGTYERMKEAGFKWAPRQELFVAPMWTPGRADLLEELCGEIEDEDRSLMERAEERADRFEDYSERRGAEADAARRQVEAITEHIPLGQPILVGHHSERRARKDAERIHNGMRKAVKLWETQDYWSRRAQAAKQHAAYKQAPDVRYRRLKGLEADLRKSQKIVNDAEVFRRLWSAEGLTQDQAVAIANRDHFMVAEADQPWGTSAYQLLTREENPRSVVDVARLGVEMHTRRIARQGRWIAHYEHRIAYERAMLDEDGGLVAESVEMQAGGQVLIRGQWLTIVRINKKGGKVLSVTTNARFVRVRGIEEVQEYKAPTEAQAATVKAAKKLPPLANYPHPGAVEMTKAEWDGTHRDYKGTREAGQGSRYEGGDRRQIAEADLSGSGLHRVRVVVRQGALRSVFITDSKVTQPPAAAVTELREAIPAPVPAATTQRAVDGQPVAREGAEAIDAMRSCLRAGGVRVVAAPQLFPTPEDIARRMVAIASPELGERVLEPSAGTGALLRCLPGVLPFAGMKQSACDVVAVEVNRALAETLRNEGLAQRVVCGDFLQCTVEDLGRFDTIIMNPPFERGADVEHIVHAQQFLAPGGRLVAICADGPRQRELFMGLGSFDLLPAGSFAGVGTQVATAMVVIRA